MYIPLGVKSDYSLLKSLIKIKDLISYLKEHNITACGLLDNKLFGVMEFYDSCINNGIKPIIGLDVNISNYRLYLYAKNYNGYKNLLKINTLIETKELSNIDLKEYSSDILCILPFKYSNNYDEISKIYDDCYIGYITEYEKNNSLIYTNKVVFINEILSFDMKDTKYLNYLRKIEDENSENISFENNYFLNNINEEDIKSTIEVANLLNLEIPKDKKYIPHYDNSIEDSYKFLVNLSLKGLSKRLNNNVSEEYKNRLKYELEVINNMGFVDYFLIVYDYVKFAKVNNILVGPGRGSAAGSLVSYCLGITDIDPLKYDLLFERFLNPERITMPDIDIDFEFTRRNEVIDYVREKYGYNRVATIITFSNLSSRQVVKDVGKILKINNALVERLSSLLDQRLDLKENYENAKVKDLLSKSNELSLLYKESRKLEGLKRQTSTHAAGVVISSIDLDEVIPVTINEGYIQCGITKDYLEDLGLLKMDFLALKNLTIIKNVINLVKENENIDIKLSDIPLDDKQTLDIFYNADTNGIFQFESSGMVNFLKKLKADNFELLVAALALYRPGPMDNIDTFIKRKDKKENTIYPVKELEPILNSTYGIMIYQEQIMQALATMGNYSFAEADNIRRAMSKKKKEVMEQEREVFVSRCIKKGYTKEVSNEVYDLILKFAGYGFNKSHSVAYALIGYQMAYLKSHYPVYFIANLLNMSIGAEDKTKEYINIAKRNDIRIYKPDINKSTDNYLVKDKNLLLPFNVIKNIGSTLVNIIIEERKENGLYIDFYDFVRRTYKKGIKNKALEVLIDADVFKSFKVNKKTLKSNIDNAITYAELCSDLDESLVMKPELEIYEEYTDDELITKELECYGFYVTNHPASKYNETNLVKLTNMKKFFDKYIKTIVIINDVRKIKTKNNEDMAFITASDETDSCEYVIFPRKSDLIKEIEKNHLYRINGQVTRRLNNYQIVISNIEKL